MKGPAFHLTFYLLIFKISIKENLLSGHSKLLPQTISSMVFAFTSDIQSLPSSSILHALLKCSEIRHLHFRKNTFMILKSGALYYIFCSSPSENDCQWLFVQIEMKSHTGVLHKQYHVIKRRYTEQDLAWEKATFIWVNKQKYSLWNEGLWENEGKIYQRKSGVFPGEKRVTCNKFVLPKIQS